MSAVWIAVIAISLLGLIFGLILGYASRRFAVQDDPVVEKIDELLPQSQCGQCGYPGCRPYAEAVGVQGEKINRCAPGGEAVMLKIAALLNVDPQPVDGDSIAWVAGIGIVINAFTAWLFIRDKEKDLNVKGAYLHMAADTLVSVGVLVSGIVIRLTGWYAIDPVVGIAIALVILFSTSKLLHDSLRLSLDGVPVGIDSERVRRSITETDPRIEDVHHVHIWAISTTQNALTAHVVVRSLDDAEELKHEIKHRLEHEGIGHATLEFELCGEHCAKECPECR